MAKLDSVEHIKKQNDLSAGYVQSDLVLPVEQMELPLDLFASVSDERPRLWLGRAGLEKFQTELQKDANYCGFADFYKKSVQPWLERDIIAEPEYYPEETLGNSSLWRPYWRKMYIECQEVLYAIKHLSIAGRILGKQELLDRAKEWLLAVAVWDTEGATSRDYNDEAAFRVGEALAWGYDWLYAELSEAQRAALRQTLIVRLEQVIYNVQSNIDLYHNPYNSHGVRSVSSFVVPLSIALYGDYAKAKEYLEYSIVYYAQYYPPWGSYDGAWGEGPHYWLTAMAYLFTAFELLKQFLGIDLYAKEFYRNTGDFIAYTMSPYAPRMSLGDESSLGDLPGRKYGYNLKILAGNTPNGLSASLYTWYAKVQEETTKGTEKEFYNYGWWDFGFDEMLIQHNYPKLVNTKLGNTKLGNTKLGNTKLANTKLPAPEYPANLPQLRVFERVGWAVMQTNMNLRTEQIHLNFKSSPYGSMSHSHGDQNAFTLHAFGETLAGRTGYYVAYGTSMHRDWQRQTRSKNAILIDGKGQYAEHKLNQFPGHEDRYCSEAKGKITEHGIFEDYSLVRGDATAAYAFHNPSIQSYVRSIYFVAEQIFVLVDSVLLAEEKTLDWLLHSTYPTTANSEKNIICVEGIEAVLNVQFIGAKLPQNITAEQSFPAVDAMDYEGQEIHYHAEAHFSAQKEHFIIAILQPQKSGAAEKSCTYELQHKKLTIQIEEKNISIDL